MRNEEFIPEELSLFDKSPLESAYVETFVYAPSSREEDGLGHLYVVAEVSSNKTKKENAEFVSKLVGVVKNEFYKNTIVTPLSALRFSLKRANRFLEEEKTWRSANTNLKIRVIVASLKENNLHFAKLGDIEAMVLRGSNLQRVVDMSSSAIKQNMAFENIVSGEVLKSDKIVLATSQIHKISEGIIIQKLKMRDLAEYLKEDSSGLKTLGLIALYPKDFYSEKKEAAKKELPPLIHRSEANIPTLASSKFNIIKPIIKKIPRIRMAAVMCILALCVITTTAVALKLRHDTAQNKKEAETLINEITDLKEKTSAMIELKNEQEASEMLKTAQEKMARLEELGYFKTTRFELASGLEGISKALNKVENIANIRSVFDIESDFDPKEISAGKNKILAFGENSYYEYDLNRNTGSSNKLEDGIKIASIIPKPENPEKNIIVLEHKIYEGNSEIWSGALDATNSGIIEAKIYNNNFYILGDNSLLYKLSFGISSSTLSTGGLVLWTNKNNRGNATQVGDFAVEGSIFTLTDPMDSEGSFHSVSEMINGDRKNTVEISEGATKIFTSESHKNVYALSPKEGMVIVLDKSLNIQKRLSNQELKDAKSFFVNSQERVIYFLKGKTVYSFEI
jgi:hypothetical protein